MVIFMPVKVLVSLLLQLSQQNAFAYPIAFVLNIVWTGFSVFIHAYRVMYLLCLVSMYLNKKINGESE